MNPCDAMVVRLGVYIGQLEAQVQELHRQLVEALKDLDEAKSKGLEPKGSDLDLTEFKNNTIYQRAAE